MKTKTIMLEKMKGCLETIEIPQGIHAEIKGEELIMSKDEKKMMRRMLEVNLEKKDSTTGGASKIIISTARSGKNQRKIVKTYAAHIKNMIAGLNNDFSYKLKICSVHFPMTVNVDKNTNELVIKNFLGEKKERRAKILPNVEVQVKGDEVIVKSSDVENAGQTAANIETVTKVNYRDRRVFQDGIFLTERKGEKI